MMGPATVEAERFPWCQAHHGADDGDGIGFPGDIQACYHILRLLAHVGDPGHRPFKRRVRLRPQLEVIATGCARMRAG